MPAARQRPVNRGSAGRYPRNGAIASIQINWKKISPDGDREERLAWIGEYLKLREAPGSLTELSDAQLGAVAGEMKRLTGQGKAEAEPRESFGGGTEKQSFSANRAAEPRENVVAFPKGDLPPRQRNAATPPVQEGSSETVFLASESQVYTLDKLDRYIGWEIVQRNGFLRRRFKCATFRMLTFKQATSATNMLLHIAAHQDLKKRNGGGPVSRVEINKYIPLLKEQLGIDRK